MEVQTESQSPEIQTSQPSAEPAAQPQPAAAPAPSPEAGAVPPGESPVQKAIREKASKVDPTIEAPKAAAPATPEFKANYKFRAADKEHEIPEFLRGVIKDEKTQKYVQQLFEKAYGIDAVKERLQRVREENSQVSEAYGKVMQTVELGRSAYQRGDLDTVFKVFNIPEEKVLQWAVRKVQLSQMPPDQRQVHEAREAAERRNWELERAQAQQSQAQMQAQSQQLHQMLDIVLERQDISDIAQSYDQRKGKPGAFRELSIQMGIIEYQQSGKVLSPLEAAQKAIDLLGGKPQTPPQQAAPAAAPPPATTAAPVQPQKVTLPNAGGAAAKAPAKAPVRSLDDLKRKYDEIAASK